MAGLFMGFSKAKPGETKKKKAPPLPPRDDNISEDSMEDMVSDFEAGGDAVTEGKINTMVTAGHSKNMSIDTDTILRNANQGLNTSHASE